MKWDLVYRTNPKKSAFLKDLLKDLSKDELKKIETHMFGPEVLLAEAKVKGGKVDDYWQK